MPVVFYSVSLPGFAVDDSRFQLDKEHPRYWQYHGKPVLLPGGSKDDNLFQIPELEEHLDLLASVGGNYIRCVDRILKSTLPYDHVLYCMTNEIHPLYPPEWGWYWAGYIRQQAGEHGKQVETSEMYWQTDLKHERLRQSIDHLEAYTFFEASQNSARKGQDNWDNLQHVWQALADRPRPINHSKVYGADSGQGWEGKDSDATARFWKNIIGGSAPSRFHRPSSGLGLSSLAQTQIRGMRMLTTELDLFHCVPDSKSRLLLDRAADEAYLTRIDGKQYAVYFPDGGSVRLDLAKVKGKFTMRWLDIANSRWTGPQAIKAGQPLPLKTPVKGQWVAMITAVD